MAGSSIPSSFRRSKGGGSNLAQIKHPNLNIVIAERTTRSVSFHHAHIA